MAKGDMAGKTGNTGINPSSGGGFQRNGMQNDSGMIGRMGQQQSGMAQEKSAYDNIMGNRSMSGLMSNMDAIRGNGAAGGGGGSMMMGGSPYMQSFQQQPQSPAPQSEMMAQMPQQQSPYQQMSQDGIGASARPQYQGETYSRGHNGIRQSSNPNQFGGQTRF